MSSRESSLKGDSPPDPSGGRSGGGRSRVRVVIVSVIVVAVVGLFVMSGGVSVIIGVIDSSCDGGQVSVVDSYESSSGVLSVQLVSAPEDSEPVIVRVGGSDKVLDEIGQVVSWDDVPSGSRVSVVMGGECNDEVVQSFVVE